MTETTNFNFNLIDFDQIPWHEDEHNNWHIADALLARYLNVSNVQGVWQNALAVTVGNRYIDSADDTIWEVLVAHTTSSTLIFSADRTANSTYWQSITVDASTTGYEQGTAYTPNTFLVIDGKYGVAVATFTSDTAAATATLSYDADVTTGNIITLIDLNDLIATTHDTNTVATGGTPTATYTSATGKFDFGLVTGATGATGAAGSDGEVSTADATSIATSLAIALG
jgi:hypothetical protein